MNTNLYKCPICGGPTNCSSINYQPQPCLHCRATLKTAEHGENHGTTLFDGGKDNETTTPAPTSRAVKECYWHGQYQLMREKYYKQMGENSQQAERIRELEEHSSKQDFLIDELADSLRAMVAHCEGFISNLKEGK